MSADRLRASRRVLAGAPLDDGDVDPRQRQLARQHQPRRASAGDHHRMLGHRLSRRLCGTRGLWPHAPTPRRALPAALRPHEAGRVAAAGDAADRVRGVPQPSRVPSAFRRTRRCRCVRPPKRTRSPGCGAPPAGAGDRCGPPSRRPARRRRSRAARLAERHAGLRRRPADEVRAPRRAGVGAGYRRARYSAIRGPSFDPGGNSACPTSACAAASTPPAESAPRRR